MALPKKLKAMNLFNDGESYIGQVTEVTLPKLTRKTESYRGAGMNGPIEIDHGQEGMKLEWTCGGLMKSVLTQYGITKHDGVQVRFTGAYQAEDGERPDFVEVVIRGRHTEIDFGNQKPGEDTSFKVTSAVSYYKLSINGTTLIEIDLLNMIENINGTDLLADLRSAIGI
ncbi:phage major tail tube protein [Trinickia sp. LjRoot230]|uniref:phage major tail tube protein n=1 Tax=Trinickia sp. LjRoot230 TaxID=3342288 RepID=UPI003ED1390F